MITFDSSKVLQPKNHRASFDFEFSSDQQTVKIISVFSNDKNIGNLFDEEKISDGSKEAELDLEGFREEQIPLTIKCYNPDIQNEPLFTSEEVEVQVRNLEQSSVSSFLPGARIINVTPKTTSSLLPIVNFEIAPFLKDAEKIEDTDAREYSFESKEIESGFSLRVFINDSEVTEEASVDFRKVQIVPQEPFQSGENKLRVSLFFNKYRKHLVEIEEIIVLDTEMPTVELREKKIFSSSLKPSFSVFAKDELSGIDSKTFEVKLHNQIYPVTVVEGIGADNEDEYQIFLIKNLWEGKHHLEILVSDRAGNQSVGIIQEITVDTIPPRIGEITPGPNSIVSGSKVHIKVHFSDENMPAIARRDIKDLYGIGGSMIKAFNEAGITKIYQLLSLDPGKYPVEGLRRVPLMRLITRAKMVLDININPKTYQNLLHKTIYDIASMNESDIMDQGAISIDQAQKLISNVNYLHNAFDIPVTQRIELGQCSYVESSPVSTVKMTLDEIDISDQVMVGDSQAECRLKEILSDGSHTLKIEYSDKLGNANQETLQFITDNTAPVISDVFPESGAFLNSSQVSLFGKFSDPLSGVDETSVKVNLDDLDITNKCKVTKTGFSASIHDLTEKKHELKVEVSDQIGNNSLFESHFYYDTTPPSGFIDRAKHLIATAGDYIDLEGEITSKDDPADTFTVEIAGIAASIKPDYRFTVKVPLSEGMNVLNAEITDRSGNSFLTKNISILRVTKDQTAVYGRVLDERGEPVASVRVYVRQTESWSLTDAEGKYCLYAKPLRKGLNLIHLKSDQSASKAYQDFSFHINLDYGQTYEVDDLVLLDSLIKSEGIPLQSGRFTEVADNSSGIKLTMPPKEEITFPDGSDEKAFVRLTRSEDFPYKPGGFSSTNYVLSMEPSGLKINNENGAVLEIPNVFKLEHDSITPIFSFDHASGRYQIAAMAKVSTDGQSIKTIAGHGIRSFSEKSLAVYEPVVEVLREDTHYQGFNSLDKGLTLQVDMPSLRYASERFNTSLVYNSRTIDPSVRVTGVFKGLKRIKSFKKLETQLAKSDIKGREAIIDVFTHNVKNLPLTWKWFPDDLSKPDATLIQYFPLEEDAVSTINEDFGKRDFHGFLDIDVRTVSLYQIEYEVTPEIETDLWPKSIKANYYMGDQAADEVHYIGTPTTYEVAGETKNTYRLPENLAVTGTIKPKIDLPTGIYSFLAKYQVGYEGFEITRYSSIAKSLMVAPGIINRIKSVRDQMRARYPDNPELLQGFNNQIKYFEDLEKNAVDGTVIPGDVRVKPLEFSSLLNRSTAGSVVINNLKDSPFGRGWIPGGIAKIYPVDHYQALLLEDDTALPFRIRETFSINLETEATSFCQIKGEKKIVLKYKDKISLFDLETQTEQSVLSNHFPDLPDRIYETMEVKQHIRRSKPVPVYADVYLTVPYPCGISWRGIKWCHHKVIGGRVKLYDRTVYSWDPYKDWFPQDDFPKETPVDNKGLVPNITDIVCDENGDLYIADAGSHRIFKLAKENGYTEWEVICGKVSEIEIATPTVYRQTTSGNIRSQTRYNKRVLKTVTDTRFSPDGTIAKDASIYHPSSLALDYEGRVVFCEKGYHRVRRINSQGRIETLAGDGTTVFNPLRNRAVETGIPSPISINYDANGSLLCLFEYLESEDENQILIKVDTNGNLTHIGGHPYGSTTLGLNAQWFKLTDISHVVHDMDQELYLYQNRGVNSRVLRVDDRGLIHEYAGGSRTDETNVIDPLDATLNSGGYMEFTEDDNLMILEGGMLRQITRSLLSSGATRLEGPVGYFDSKLIRLEDDTWRREFQNGKVQFFDEKGLLIRTQLSRRRRDILYEYNEFDQPTKIAFGRRKFIAFIYDTNQRLSSISDHIGRTTEVSINDKDLEEVRLPDGRVVQFSYDDVGRIMQKIEL